MRTLFLLAIILSAGCASDTAYDGLKRDPKAQIDVFSGESKPTKPYKEIASFTERGNPEDESKFNADFAKRAKKMGADGVILRPGQPGGTSYGPLGGGTFYIFRGVAFVYE
jgi:hypothetical protein